MKLICSCLVAIQSAFNDLYYILDVCNTMKKNTVIILCKNFHKIHPELLDIFYSYIHDIPHKNINFKYIFLTENISFIRNNFK